MKPLNHGAVKSCKKLLNPPPYPHRPTGTQPKRRRQFIIELRQHVTKICHIDERQNSKTCRHIEGRLRFLRLQTNWLFRRLRDPLRPPIGVKHRRWSKRRLEVSKSYQKKKTYNTSESELKSAFFGWESKQEKKHGPTEGDGERARERDTERRRNVCGILSRVFTHKCSLKTCFHLKLQW